MNNVVVKLKKNLNAIILRTAKEKKRFLYLPNKDFTRKGKISFQVLLKLIFSMDSGSLGKELLEYFSIGRQNISASAFVQLREKVMPEAFEHIFREFTRKLPHIRRYEGFRLLAVDGCKFGSVENSQEPDNHFKTFPNKKGFNIHNLNALYDLCNRFYVDAILRTGKKDSICKDLNIMVDRSPIRGKTIVLADRAYTSYNVFEHIAKKGWNYVIRATDLPFTGSIISKTSFPATGAADQWFHLKATRRCGKVTSVQRDIYRYMPSNQVFDFLPPGSTKEYPLHFRVVRLEVSPGIYELLVTNLEASKFPPEKLKTLYHLRWGIETSFRELKYTIGVLSFHSKKDESIKQEIFAGLTKYNFCEAITTQAIIMQEAERVSCKKTRKHVYQVNFTMAIHICLGYFKGKYRATSQEVLREILKHVEPLRTGRAFLRKKQRRTIISFLYRMN